jgi:NAD(P)-dependent dehydrogenase (short-subunit alcohol dehydrogenase family)
MTLQDKVIVVTGGTGILGYSFNKAIAKAGGTVCILGRNKEKAEERAAEIVTAGGKAIGLVADVLNETDLQSTNKIIIKKFRKIDGLVNGAGGNQPKALVQPEDDLFNLNMEAFRAGIEVEFIWFITSYSNFWQIHDGNF